MFTTIAASLASSEIVAHAGHYGPGFGWGFIFIPLIWLAVLVTVLALFGRRFRRAAWARGGFGPYAQPSRGAESTLAERFAQGDIDEKEYRARLEVLRANAYPQNPKG